MVTRNQVYRCGVCGNIVEVLHAGGGQLVCCGQPMTLQDENTVDAAKEKHVPVIERTATGITVKVGGVPHPMEEKHWIQWIELLADERVYRKYLKPGDKPEATFPPLEAARLAAREYCNLHGQWKA
ncbi:MAG: desulfoferrodoxin [Deltaproteobacteria bacterium]|nr:desulfoferrodoxin [Deltaproteobacteria bacterium]